MQIIKILMFKSSLGVQPLRRVRFQQFLSQAISTYSKSIPDSSNLGTILLNL